MSHLPSTGECIAAIRGGQRKRPGGLPKTKDVLERGDRKGDASNLAREIMPPSDWWHPVWWFPIFPLLFMAI
jgi:hypothetical protein